MKAKQRLIAAIKGEETDRIPWSPNVPYWWEAQSKEFTNRGEIEFLKEIGADPLIRGHYPYKGKTWEDMALFKLSFKHCEVKEHVNSDEKYKVYETPVGRLEFVYKYTQRGDTWFLYKHGVKSEKDFKTLIYLFEDTVVAADYDKYCNLSKMVGDEALLVPQLNPYLKSSFQSMVEYWVGTEELTYAVYDYPEIVEQALAAMTRISLEAANISALSDAEVFITWEDSSTTNISPSLYEKYILPEINAWCDILHKNGKIYLQHACGHLKDLLPIMAKSGIDCIESISPPPTGNIDLWAARKIIPDHIGLIGGIEPTIFLNSSLEQLEEYTLNLLDKLKGSRFVLANSDSCPPGVEIEKFKRISEIVGRR